jgi:hypothetical protein
VKLFGFLRIIIERQGPEKGTFISFCLYDILYLLGSPHQTKAFGSAYTNSTEESPDLKRCDEHTQGYKLA